MQRPSLHHTSPSNGSIKFDNTLAAHSVPLLGNDMHESHFAADSQTQIPFKLNEELNENSPDTKRLATGWIPLPLRGWFWIPFIVFLVAVGIGLEIALKVTNDRQGWVAHGDIADTRDVFHYVYTLPPVAVAAVIVALWAWTDIEIKKLQPYIDLVHGDAAAEHSLLLDYTRTNNFFVWTKAARNRHYLVSLASLMLLMSLTFQPLAAALLIVRSVYSREPDMVTTTLATVGLNQNAEFSNLTSFLTAAGFAGAAVLYNLGNAPFVHNQYTIPPFQIPTTTQNGTIFTNTTALKSDTGCVSVNVDMEQHIDGSGWTNTVSYNGCVISFVVDKNATTLFGTDIPSCDPSIPPQFSPALFWFFTYDPSPLASATLCYPTFTLWEASVAMDIASHNITHVTELRPFTASSPFSDNSANVTGEPLNGRAYNGIMFNLTDPDRFVLARANATQLQLPAAVYQAALQTQQGAAEIFSNATLEPLVNSVYSIYLSLVAKEVYFLPAQEPITLQIMTVRQRLFFSPVSVHLLCTALLLLAFFGLLIHLFHLSDRRDLRLQHEPGTIASAVSIAAGTSLAGVLAEEKSRGHLHEALQGRKFMMDQTTGRLVMDNEVDYHPAQRPSLLGSIGKRMSVLVSPTKMEFQRE